MTQRQSEAIVLRTWPFEEADLLVSLLTREQGRIKGVARHAMRSRRRFGGALEVMTHVRATYAEKPKQDLVRLDGFEILWSPLADPWITDEQRPWSFVAEVLEEALPEQAPEDSVFRLAVAVLAEMQIGPYLDAGNVLRSVDESTDGMDAGTNALWSLWIGSSRQGSVVLLGCRWSDV